MKSTLKPKVSIVVPVHDMRNRDFFLKRCLDSIESQTFKEFEVIMPENGKGMAPNINEGIFEAKGEIVKFLFMDDYFATPHALQNVIESWKGGWLVTACEHDDGMDRYGTHFAKWSERISEGENTIGSPSVLAFENRDPEFFDETLSWTLDCDLYLRLYKRYGPPTILNDINVIIGVGEHQTTHLLSDEIKQKEVEYTKLKHG